MPDGTLRPPAAPARSRRATVVGTEQQLEWESRWGPRAAAAAAGAAADILAGSVVAASASTSKARQITTELLSITGTDHDHRGRDPSGLERS